MKVRLVTALAVFLLLHGIAHLPGFLVSWRLTNTAEMPYRTTVLSGAVDVGDTGILVMGLLWLVAAVGFAGAAITTWRGYPVWPRLALGVTLLSLVLCVLGWPDSRVGLILDLMLLGLLAVVIGVGR